MAGFLLDLLILTYQKTAGLGLGSAITFIIIYLFYDANGIKTAPGYQIERNFGSIAMVSSEMWFAAIPGLILFLYGLDQFSREIQKVAGERFRSFLASATKSTIRGTILGAIVTAIIQSSTMVTIITIGLVDSGLVSFAQSLSVLLGAGVGTTITAQLVAFKFTSFGPVFIPIGFLLSIFGKRFAFLGKPIFYFGLVFFGIGIVSQAMLPLRDDPAILSHLSGLSNVPLAILSGFILTNVFQSSSIFTGLIVMLVETGFIPFEHSVPLIMGANIGTITPLISSLGKGLYARRTAIAHAFFNLISVIIILPILPQFTSFINGIGGSPAQQTANAHTIFNLIFAFIFLLAIRPIAALIERIVPGKEEEILFRTIALDDELPEESHIAFNQIELELKHLHQNVKRVLEDAESLYEGYDERRFQMTLKRENLTDYIDGRIGRAIRELTDRHMGQKDAMRMVMLLRMSNALEQISDAAASLAQITNSMHETGAIISAGASDDIAHIFAHVREDMELLENEFPSISHNTLTCMRQNEFMMRKRVNAAYSNHLVRLHERRAYAAGAFVKSISRLDSAHGKVRELAKLCELYKS